VVIDRGCILPAGLSVGDNKELDEKRFYRTESGIVLITQEMLDKLN
jgi:glucose-1-phosphate adenylyltransferase